MNYRILVSRGKLFYEQEVNIRRAGYSLSLSFSVSQHIKDKELLERLARYFNCGTVRVANNRNSAEWIVTKLEDIRFIIIPFLNKYQLSFYPPRLLALARGGEV